MVHVPSIYVEEARFMTYTAANHHMSVLFSTKLIIAAGGKRGVSGDSASETGGH